MYAVEYSMYVLDQNVSNAYILQAMLDNSYTTLLSYPRVADTRHHPSCWLVLVRLAFPTWVEAGYAGPTDRVEVGCLSHLVTDPTGVAQ